jgi:methyltransferase (TIGR00027 family)
MTRTDDDRWDPATGVGMTATFGAAARAVATNRGLIDDPFAERLVRAAGVEYFTQLIDDQRYAADGVENPLITGMMDVLAAHTRFLDHFLTEAVRVGIRQVVVLGSGLDTRPYRLWWPAGTSIYEIDQPEVIDFKVRELRGLGARLAANRYTLGTDLRQDWRTALRRVGFDAAQPTVWIAENLLVGYLSPKWQSRLLEDVSALSAAGSRFAADHISTWSASQVRGGLALMDRWRESGVDVELAGLTYRAEYREVPDHLAARGWQTAELDVVEMLAAGGVVARTKISAGDVAVAPRYLTAAKV